MVQERSLEITENPENKYLTLTIINVLTYDKETKNTNLPVLK